MGLSVEVVRKPPKPVPEEVAKVWAREWAKEGKKIDWQSLMPPRGYVALPRRWVVERTFSWLVQNRRLSLRTTRGFVRARRRSRLRGHDQADGKANSPWLRIFQTVSPRNRVNKGNERGPRLLETPILSLLASVVVGARPFLALLLSASS